MAWRVFPVSDPSLKPQWVGMNIDDFLGPSSANETSGMIFFIIFCEKAIKDLAKLLISVSSFQLLDLWTVWDAQAPKMNKTILLRHLLNRLPKIDNGNPQRR